jgi:hypothetical protein
MIELIERQDREGDPVDASHFGTYLACEPATCRIASVDVPLRLVLPVLTVQGLRIVAVLYK